MTDPSQLPERPHSFWEEYRFEIIWLLVVMLGVLLLVERINIRATLRSWIVGAAQMLWGGLSQAVQRFVTLVVSTTVSNFLGVLLIVVAMVAILWRLRWRVMHSEGLSHPACPMCGGELHRVHRYPRDRILAFFIPVKRYRCKDRTCGWSGLRVASSPLHSHRRA